jgi:hypothetical protein
MIRRDEDDPEDDEEDEGVVIDKRNVEAVAGEKLDAEIGQDEKEHQLFARNLCPRCPVSIPLSWGKTNGPKMVYCCPQRKTTTTTRTVRTTSTRKTTVVTTRTVTISVFLSPTAATTSATPLRATVITPSLTATNSRTLTQSATKSATVTVTPTQTPSATTSETQTTSESTTTTEECFPTSAAVLVLERDGPVKRTIGDIRVGDVVQSISNGKLDWSTVYVDLHRSAGLSTYLHLITANATLKLSAYHMVPALIGGCTPSAPMSAAKWVPAALLNVGDGIFTPLTCSPIVALGSSEERGFANPITFSGHIVVDGVLATVWAFAGPPDARPGMYADGDVTALWRKANEIVIQYPFKAIYFITRPVYLVLP